MDASTSPGRHPYRFRQCEMRSLLQAGLEGAEAWRLAVAQWGAVTAVPVRQQAKVNLVIVPAGGTKRGQDFLPSQNFRQFSLWATRLDDCRHQAREPGRAKETDWPFARLNGQVLISRFRNPPNGHG